MAAASHPVESARAAGLIYVTDCGPGIRRQRSGESFDYIGPDEQPIRDPARLRWIQELGIPPAWTDVWICPAERGHLQATGRDAKGRKQYRYHPRWREVREQTKFDRMISFGEALPQIRARVERDLAIRGMNRERLLATVVRLLETTMIRVGNEEYVRQNRSFGLTTMRNRHVDVEGATLRFHFRGKSGKKHVVEVHDRRLASIIKRCRDIPGHHLFEYTDDDGQVRTVSSGDVNDYLREISGREFTAKDFRTWAGTLLMVRALQEGGPCESESGGKKNIVQAIDRVRERLGNTRAVCRKYYVHPAVLDAYLAGSLPPPCKSPTPQSSTSGLSEEETAVLAFLKHQRDHQALLGSQTRKVRRDEGSEPSPPSVERRLRRGSPVRRSRVRQADEAAPESVLVPVQ